MGPDHKDAIISAIGKAEFRLRMIEAGDIEDLRKWKNLNKASFFLKSDITPEQQAQWYAKFMERDGDLMFVVEQDVEGVWEKIGCMGFRVLPDEECVDAYNIIRSRKIEPAAFTMKDPFRTMLAYANELYEDLPIRCKVLSGNPAVRWYEKNKFFKLEEADGYYLMELDKSSIKDLELVVDKNL